MRPWQALVLVLLLSVSIEGKTFLQIDNFNDAPAPLTLVTPESQPEDNYYWWSPYDNNHPPAVSYQNYEGALGGQRDLLIGWEGFTPVDTVAVVSVSNGSGAISFEEGFSGGAYFQWDGEDFGDPLVAFPESLSVLPGIGAHINTTAFTEQNSDGISVDFTSGGNATGIYMEIISDRSVNYFLDAIDANRFANHIEFAPSASTSSLPYFFPFDDWENPYFDWNRVVAFQVRLWTYNFAAAALETSFSSLSTFGYVITGNVQQSAGDCESEEFAVQNVQIDIFESVNPTYLLSSAFTDINGAFSFAGSYLVDQTPYNVCLHNVEASCSPSCFVVVLENFQDPPALQYIL